MRGRAQTLFSTKFNPSFALQPCTGPGCSPQSNAACVFLTPCSCPSGAAGGDLRARYTPELNQLAHAQLKRCSLVQGESFQYQIYPRIDKLACTMDEIGGGAGPTAQAQRRLLQTNEAAKLGLVSLDTPACLHASCAEGLALLASSCSTGAPDKLPCLRQAANTRAGPHFAVLALLNGWRFCHSPQPAFALVRIILGADDWCLTGLADFAGPYRG